MISRRGLITGLVGLVAAPAIVRVESLMKVRAIDLRGDWRSATAKFVVSGFDAYGQPVTEIVDFLRPSLNTFHTIQRIGVEFHDKVW